MTAHYDYNNYTTDWVMEGDGKRGNSFILIYYSLVQSTELYILIKTWTLAHARETLISYLQANI